MEKVLDMVRKDINSFERANIGVQCGEYEIRAFPKTAGSWKVAFRCHKETERVGTLNNKQLEFVIVELLRSSDFSEFDMITQRDRNGYYIGSYYKAIQKNGRPKRKFDDMIRRLIAATTKR